MGNRGSPQGGPNQIDVARIILDQQNSQQSRRDEAVHEGISCSAPGAVGPFPPQREVEGRAMAWLGFDPHSAAVQFHYFFTYGEPDSGARVFFACMQSLKNLKNALEVLLLDADAIIAHDNFALRIAGEARNFDLRRIAAAKFKGVRDEILEQLREQRHVAGYGRGRSNPHFGAGFLNGGGKIQQHALHDFA